MPVNVPTSEELSTELDAMARAIASVRSETNDKIADLQNGLGGAIDAVMSEAKEARSEASEAAEMYYSLRDDLGPIEARLSLLEAKVFPAPEPDPEPEPEPEPPPPQPKPGLKVADFKLIGGIRLAEPFSGGGLAIDFDKGLIYQGGHSQRDSIVVYQLPEIGLGEPGDKHANWPVAQRLRETDPFWKSQAWGDFPNLPDHNLGLTIHDGKLWVSPRVKYDTAGKNRWITLCCEDGNRANVPLDRAGFGGGFVEGIDHMILAGGGYRSGQGSKAGPTVARINGEILLNAPFFNDMRFDLRTPRASGSFPITGKDEWYAFIPRKADGSLCTQEEALAGEGIGAWNSDSIYDGGIWTPRGLCFWAMMGMGVLDYKLQSEQFAKSGMSRPFLYTYDPDTFTYQGFEEWTWGEIHGCEVGPDGRIYLMRANAWKSGYYQVDSAIYVFEVQ